MNDKIIAFIRLACMLVSSGLAMFGMAIEADALFTGAMCVLAVAAYVWGWWKNNNVTEAAKEAQKVIDEIKKGSQENAIEGD